MPLNKSQRQRISVHHMVGDPGRERDDQIVKALSLWKRGYSWNAIAAECGTTLNGIKGVTLRIIRMCDIKR